MTKKKAPEDHKKPGRKGTRQTNAKRAAVPMTKKGVIKGPDGLNPSQVQVLCALLAGRTQQQAAEAAGVTQSGVSYMLSLPAFQEALAKARADIAHQAQIDAQWLISELVPIARADIRQFFDNDGSFLDMATWTEDMGKSVASIEVNELFDGVGKEREQIGVTKKLRFWPKTDAVDKLAKLLGAYKPTKVEHFGRVDGVADVLALIDGSDVGPGPAGTS